MARTLFFMTNMVKNTKPEKIRVKPTENQAII
jgi:hypothetical protein